MRIGEVDMLHAKRHELKIMFFMHYSIYQSAGSHTRNSHRLLLFYAVECGLKAMLLKKINGNTTKDLASHNKLNKLSGKNGHNIKYMLSYLGYSQFTLPELPCKNNLIASCTEYNQVWRYGIEVECDKESQIEKELSGVAEWIKGRI